MVKIDKINNQYFICRRIIEKKNYQMQQWQKEINSLAENYQLEQANIIKAKRENNNQREKQAKDNIEQIRKKVAEIEKEATGEAQEIDDMLQKIKELLETILKDDTLRDDMIQCLEEQYVYKIEKLVKKQEKLDSEYRIIEKIETNPELIEFIQKMIETLVRIRKINYVIDNLEHNGMLSEKEASNQILLEESKKEKVKKEKRIRDICASMRDILSVSEYLIVEGKIKEMVEQPLCGEKEVDINKKVERRKKEIKEQKRRVEESIDINKKELKLLKQKKKNKWRKKGIGKSKKEEVGDKRNEFLNRIEYEIVREGMYQIKNEIRAERKEKEEKINVI